MATDARQRGRETPGEPGAPALSQIRGIDLTTLHRRAISSLSAELLVDEMPRIVICGLASSAIVATDRRVFVFKTGARSGLPFGSRLKEFEYESIMRVDLREGDAEHVVVLHAPLKISVCASYWADRRDDPWKARNAIPVDPSPAVEAAVAEVSQMLAEFQHRTIARRSVRAADRRASDAGTPDVLDRLANLEVDVLSPPPGPVSLPPAPAGAGAPGPVAEDCPRCGAELDVGWEFCPRCGAPASLRESDRTPSRRRLRFP